ncbi:MAG: hypothetical protein EBU21_15095 [Proteobacteria bacterium]|nr:hypothetical protein [Pseudomonadota bacterium]
MSSAFSSVDEAVTFFDARENFPGVWLGRCPSCSRDRGLAISLNSDQTVALGCQDACTDSAIGLAVIAKRNLTGAITTTGTVPASASPSGVGIAEPVPVSMAETATGTVLPEHRSDGSGALVIDLEFRDLIRPLAIEERKLLEESIVTHGCRDAIVVWQGIIVDGHHRFEICQRLDIPFSVHALRLEDDTREGALAWLIDNQLARRNLHPDEASMLRGHAYRITAGGPGPRSGSLGNFYPDSRDQRRTSERLAQKYGVSEKTIRNDADYLGAVEGIESLGVPRSSLVGRPDAPRQSAIGLAGLLASSDPDQQARGERMVGLMRDGASLRDAFVKPTKATGRAGGPHETADAAVDVAGEADGKRKRASHPRQATVSAQATYSASASVPDAVEASPAGQFDADQGSGDSDEVTEIVADKPDIEVSRPAEPRQTLFDTEEPASAEVSAPVGPKRGKAAGTRAGGSATGVPTDPEELAEWLYALLGLAGSKEVVKRLQEVCVRESMRVLPKPGQLTFV